jgi:general secretion pathway protein F
MLSITGLIQQNFALLVGLLAAVILGVPVLLRVPRVRDTWQSFLLRVPIVGRLMTLQAAAQYLRTLALVVTSRQPVVDGVESAARLVQVRSFRSEAERVITTVRAGAPLSAALGETSFIPPVARQLVQAGEESARLGRMTERAAVLVETWLRDYRKRVSTFLDPALMMLVGAFVLVVVLSVLLPIFDLQAAITY